MMTEHAQDTMPDFLTSHEANMQANGYIGYTIPPEVRLSLEMMAKERRDLLALGFPSVMRVSAGTWYTVQNTLFQTLSDGTVTIQDFSESDSVFVRERLGLEQYSTDLLVEPVRGEPINMEERRPNKSEKILQGQSVERWFGNDDGCVYCDCCNKYMVGRQYRFLNDVECFFRDPKTQEDLCAECVNGHTDGLTRIATREAIEALYAEAFRAHRYDTLEGLVRCGDCDGNLCDADGHATGDFYVRKTDDQFIRCECCQDKWMNSMPWFHIRVSLVKDGESLTIAVQRKPLSIAAIVNVIVGMKRWRSRAMERLYDPTCGLGAQLAKASFEDAVAEQATLS